MFDGLTAWFSISVEKRTINQWVENKGKVTDTDDAQFLFSKDSEVHDTKSLYKSLAYLDEHLAVFHAQYIEDCVKKGHNKDTVLGQYFLPPLEIQNFMRKQIKFVWQTSNTEKTNMGKKSEASSSGDNSAPPKIRKVHTDHCVSVDKQTDLDNEIVNIDDLPMVQGKLEEFIPGQNGCEVFLKS